MDYRNGLENRRGAIGSTVGSNPTLSGEVSEGNLGRVQAGIAKGTDFFDPTGLPPISWGLFSRRRFAGWHGIHDTTPSERVRSPLTRLKHPGRGSAPSGHGKANRPGTRS